MKSLRNPWWECLIVKLLGRRISLAALTRRLEIMWSRMGSIEVIDLGNDFFIVKFFSSKDLDFALTGGPWRIFDNYLTIRPWQLDFNPKAVTIDRIAAWVRLPGLDIEYYEETMLRKIGNIIGRTLRVDPKMAEKCREKFARLCVELNLTEPLVSQYSINGKRYLAQYEGLHCICFTCGMVGHEKSNYSKSQMKIQTSAIIPAMSEGRTEETLHGHNNGEGSHGNSEKDKGKKFSTEDNSTYGSWMQI
ncbi:uncharacterized protein LOC107468934 [Arachis duranensis]|uniref:Uncharacterized protein LOC107468934 n=1 Tax=Arachis duranensis TaxID=130453 RepID=A0A6P4C561_ARADU|nr:uncharacterized protein LOC107468934 [Arachis duranensis]